MVLPNLQNSVAQNERDPGVVIVTLHADPATAAGTQGGGGTHSYIRELMIGFADIGWRLTVLTRWADPELPQRETIVEGIDIIRLRIGNVEPLDKHFLNDLHSTSLSAARSALESCAAPKLLHSVYWNSGRVAMDLSQELSVPFVHTVISNGWRRRAEKAHDQPSPRLHVERSVFQAAFAVLCIASEERNDLIEHYGVDPGKILVVGRPVADQFLQPCRDELGRPARPQARRTMR